MNMKRLLVVLMLTLPIVVFAQRGGGGAGRGGGGGRAGGGNAGGGYAGPSRGSGFIGGGGNLGPTPFAGTASGLGPYAGFGSVVFPGGGSSFGTVVSPIYSNNQSFAGRLGTVVSGVPPSIVAPGPGFGLTGNSFIGRGRTAVYPVPVFVGGYGYGYNNGYYSSGYQDPNVTIINTPPVIINQNYEPDPPARPSMQVYGNGVDSSVNTIQIPSPSYPEGKPINSSASTSPVTNPNDEPTVYLIALKDGTIYASYAFWTERDTLHYITPGHAHNQVSMDRVDVPLSRRLNVERHLDFNLK